MPVTRRLGVAKSRKAGHPQISPHDDMSRGKPSSPRLPPAATVTTARHLYHVGQRLRLASGGSVLARASAGCRVIALVPHEHGPFQYRISSELESFERVVSEVDLVLPDLP